MKTLRALFVFLCYKGQVSGRGQNLRGLNSIHAMVILELGSGCIHDWVRVRVWVRFRFRVRV